ncbi:MAG: HAD-IIB family hydrolase, partial [Acidobacteria bacterium]|nr:HAD-IIB family hydrolase [Acidobacteriota bacterium]
LDHDTYDWAPACAALERLRAAGVPVVLNSSKTAAEQMALREKIGNGYPFIVENGAAVYWPGEQGGFEVERFGADRAELVALAHQLRQERDLCFEGFTDWTPEQLAAIADLPVETAALALERCCSEPILWRGGEASLHWFVRRIEDAGYRVVQGGRFLHLMGRFDKAEAMRWVAARYGEQWGAQPTIVALGDSPNDADMLDAADIAVGVRSAKSDRVRPSRPSRILRTEDRGPAGWQEAMDALLPTLLADN